MPVEEYQFLLLLAEELGFELEDYSSSLCVSSFCEPLNVLRLSLSGRNLSDRMFGIHLIAFKNLVALDLSSNGLQDIKLLRLTRFSNLEALDLHDNQISNSLEEIGQILDRMHLLEAVALRGNPCMDSKTKRSTLLSLLGSLGRPGCRLHTLDTCIRVPGRMALIASRPLHQIHDSDDERIRIAILQRSMPRQATGNLEQLEELDLSDLDITFVSDLRTCSSLRRLLLRGNRLRSWEHLSQILPRELAFLEVLDVRDNRIASLSGLGDILERAPTLQSLGVSGNLFCDEMTDFRDHITRMAFQRSGGTILPLRMIDEAPVSTSLLLELHNSQAYEPISLSQLRIIQAVSPLF